MASKNSSGASNKQLPYNKSIPLEIQHLLAMFAGKRDIVNKSGLPVNFKEKMKYTLIKRRKAILDAYPDWKKEIIKG